MRTKLTRTRSTFQRCSKTFTSRIRLARSGLDEEWVTATTFEIGDAALSDYIVNRTAEVDVEALVAGDFELVRIESELM